MSDFNPVPKMTYKKRKPSRKKRGEFNQSTKEEIYERDGGLCRVCKRQAHQIHHVVPKGSGKGRGVATNGMLVCNDCHDEIHRNGEKLKFWKDAFGVMYGYEFYKDEYDKE